MSASAKYRKAAERATKRKSGLEPMEVWSRPELKPRIRKYVERLNRRAARLNGAEHG